MHYRLANREDLPTLNRISFAAKQHWGYPDEWMEHWREGLLLREEDLQKLKVVIVETAADILGFCALHQADDYSEVEHLWILPQHMGKGYGKHLLSYTLTNYAILSLPIKVVADPNAEGFYAKHGFSTYEQEESYPPGRFLPVMRMESFG